MSSRTERLKRKSIRFVKQQYDELTPKEAKRVARFLKSKEPRLRASYETRKVRGRQQFINLLNSTTSKVRKRKR
jgi:hypothetical protein